MEFMVLRACGPDFIGPGKARLGAEVTGSGPEVTIPVKGAFYNLFLPAGPHLLKDSSAFKIMPEAGD